MPIGVRFAKFSSLKLTMGQPGERVSITQQISLWDDEPNGSNNREGYIEYIGISEYSKNYKKFKIVFYKPDNINGYYKNERISTYLAEETRFFYVNEEEKYVLIFASKADAKKILEILQQNDYMTIVEYTLDLNDVKQRLNQDRTLASIRGAWIRMAGNANISTIAIFGSDIDSTEEFSNYTEGVGNTISVLIINNSVETIGIANDYGAIFYNRRSELNLLDGYEIVKELLKELQLWK